MSASPAVREPTAAPALDAALAELRAGAAAWVAQTPGNKAALLEACRRCVAGCAGRWTADASRAKGIEGTPRAGEESISGPWAVLLALEHYARTLRQIAAGGAPRIDPRRVRQRKDGQVVVDVFPTDSYDRFLLDGVRAEVWMQAGVTAANLDLTLGTWYRRSEQPPRVAVVLGAGNISSIAALDVLSKLVADGTVCMLKLNPVNEYLGPILERAFRPLFDARFLRLAYGGSDVGEYLCRHPNVDEIHVTGSARTHDAIVFGSGPDAADRKRRHAPLLRKPIASELGNVSPTIVVPGSWTRNDVRFQAEHIVTQKLHNAGFNCIASQVLVVPAQWQQTAELLAEIERLMRDLPARPAYYPGAAERYAHLAAGRGTDAGAANPTVVYVDAADTNEAAFVDEAFCSLLAVAALPGDVETFLANAVAFANDRLWGTLGANLVVHPSTARRHAQALDRAVAELRYGCIGINAWTGVGFLLPVVPWGAYPGNSLENVGSGIGVVHNSHLFSRSEKSVVTAPFAPFPRSLLGYGATLLPKPPWFTGHRRQAEVGEALCRFESARSPLGAAKVALLAMRG